MTTKKIPPAVPLQTRVSPAMKKAIQQFSKKNHISQSDVVRIAVEEYLNSKGITGDWEVDRPGGTR